MPRMDRYPLEQSLLQANSRPLTQKFRALSGTRMSIIVLEESATRHHPEQD
jgi:hypothetical protein